MGASTKFLTISVDDGHPTDAQTASLLKKHGLKATFYIPRENPERTVMGEAAIRELAQDPDFEMGGHTISHLSLHRMAQERAFAEIKGGKDWLEGVIGRKTAAFCYPQGKFNNRTPGLVREAGYAGGRTCQLNLSGIPADPFLWGVSTHAYSHTPLIQLRHALLEKNFRGSLDFFRVHQASADWEQHFLHSLLHVEAHGGVAHLFLHSWEIAEQNQWEKLGRAFEAAAAVKGLERITNGALFQRWSEFRA